MNDKQTLHCDIIDLSYDGRGIGRINGKTCFIEGALPTEQVEFRLINQKRNYDEGAQLKFCPSLSIVLSQPASTLADVAAVVCSILIIINNLNLNSSNY